MYRQSENYEIELCQHMYEQVNIELIRIFHEQKELTSKLQSKVASEPS